MYVYKRIIIPCVGVCICVSLILPFFSSINCLIRFRFLRGKLRMEFLISSQIVINAFAVYEWKNCLWASMQRHIFYSYVVYTHTQNIYSTTPCENANFIYIKKIEKLQWKKKHLLIYAHFRSFIFNRLVSTSFIPSVRLTVLI